MTKDGVEIDLIIERPNQKTLFVKIKSSTRIDPAKFTSALKIKNKLPQGEFIVCCQEAYSREVGEVFIFPWQEALEYIFNLSP